MILANRGFVFPMTLVMLVIMILLTLSLMQSLFFYLKLTQQINKKHADFYALESTALRLAQSMKAKEGNECTMSMMDPNQMIEMLQIHQGCSYTHRNRRYEYLIDDLGLYPCLKIRTIHGLNSSHHWLITVISLSDSSILQLRIAQPVKILSCDEKIEHMIHSGIMSWRLI